MKTPREKFLRALSRLCFLLVLFFAVTARAQSADAQLLTLEGKVEVAAKDTSAWQLGSTNQTLHVGDRLRTGLRARATVRLSNLTTLRVNELTTLQIQPPSANSKQAGLDLKNGSTYFLSRERGNETEFRTPLASGAIRGTEFHLAVADDGRSEVTLIDGAVTLANEHGTVDMTSGEQGVVENGQAPRKSPFIEAINIIQWTLYYPGVIDVDELQFLDGEKTALAESLAAYRAGDLSAAREKFPVGSSSLSEASAIYQAALDLSVGQTATALALPPSPQADALREVIAAVKNQSAGIEQPTTAAQWLAKSYCLQSQFKLTEALAAARNAATQSPNFGFAWARLAELEFSFGHTATALAALEKSLQLSPRNTQAVALKGFLLAAQNKISAAQNQFDTAITLDPALATAWLGRGLCRIKRGDAEGGRADLQVAATLEPHRAVLRSYLGKAFANAGDEPRAAKELQLAQKFDPNDPTAWLYSALLAQQGNKINDAVTDLEKSQDLNDNRKLFRSRLLLDQDRAVRSANLAGVYRDAGMTDASVREASRAVNADYGNFSAHQFLASSYDALRDPKQVNLRYETPWLSELLVANLLAPVGAGNLSTHVSQQEYSKLFERDKIGVSSVTEYRSRGLWDEQGSVYGTFGKTSFAVDAEHHSDPGTRPNNDVRQFNLSVKLKQQVTEADTLLVQAQYYDAENGDVSEYYHAASTSPTLRVTEKQRPNLYLGWHHEWSPGSHTLLLLSRLDDTLTKNSPDDTAWFLRYARTTGLPFNFTLAPFGENYRREFGAYSAELQQVFHSGAHTLVAGARFQAGGFETTTALTNLSVNVDGTNVVWAQNSDTKFARFTGYAYYEWQPLDALQFTAGGAYDWLEFPVNIDVPPLTGAKDSRTKFSPKLGFIWTPLADTHLRGAWTRSLGGVSFDNSVRLEPVQVAGFSQAFRSLAPEGVAGLVAGTAFETWSVALDHEFKKTRTYFGVEANLLQSDALNTVGIVTNSPGSPPDGQSSTRQSVNYRERTIAVTLNQLVARDWALAARYAISDSELRRRFVDIPTGVALLPGANQHTEAVLQQLTLAAIYNHPRGFFARGESVWTHQANLGDTAALPDADFWQFNLFAGWRFYHRAAELQLGVLNLGDQDYSLNPVSLYNAAPRGREFVARFKFNF